MRLIILFTALAVLGSVACRTAPGPSRLHPWGPPQSADSALIILNNRAYDCGYTPSLLISRWAAYLFTRTPDSHLPRYRGGFRADPRLDSTVGPLPLDYRETWRADRAGYDRGHQVPDAAAKSFGREAQTETYYLTNITPQHSRFNQGFWHRLENYARDRAGAYDTIWVVTGPVFFADRETLRVGGLDRVCVPHAYFKTIARKRPDRVETYLVPHQPENLPWYSAPNYLVGKDSVETLTGLKLFPDLREHDFGLGSPLPNDPSGKQ